MVQAHCQHGKNSLVCHTLDNSDEKGSLQSPVTSWNAIKEKRGQKCLVSFHKKQNCNAMTGENGRVHRHSILSKD